MNHYALIKYKKLTPSLIAYNSGQTPQEPTFIKEFINLYTGDVFSINSIDEKKKRRQDKLFQFSSIYLSLWETKRISIFSMVASEKHYTSASKFINMIKRKFKRKSVDVFGYIWIRDVGDIKFKQHFHILIATTTVNSSLYEVLFSNIDDNRYSVEQLKTKYGMIKYLNKKEIFAKKNYRNHQASRAFKKPKMDI